MTPADGGEREVSAALLSIERVAQHRNGGGARPYISVRATSADGRPLQAFVFETPGHLVVYDLIRPLERLCAGDYEHALRTAIAEVGFLYNVGDPLVALVEHAEQVRRTVHGIRAQTPPGPDRARLRKMSAYLLLAIRSIKDAMERATR